MYLQSCSVMGRKLNRWGGSMANEGNSNGGCFGWIIAIAVVACIGQMCGWDEEPESDPEYRHSSDKYQTPRNTTGSSGVSYTPPSSSQPFTTASNGYDWAKATYDQRTTFCDALSQVTGRTAAWWYGALDGLYGDPVTDSISFDDACRMLNAAGP